MLARRGASERRTLGLQSRRATKPLNRLKSGSSSPPGLPNPRSEALRIRCRPAMTTPPRTLVQTPPDTLAARFVRTREATVALARPLSSEDCQVQSMPTASPVKWHLAHTTWFFETFVLERDPAYRCFHPDFRQLFNSYYVSVGEAWSRPRRGLLTRPSLAEVLAYRAHVDDALSRRLERGFVEPDALWTVGLGLAHEEQHQELLLTDVKHLLSANPLFPVYSKSPGANSPLPSPASEAGKPLRWHAFEGGLTEIGHAGGSFAFDNETPRHKVHLEPFELASRPTTNAEWLAFLQGGAYRRPELWLSDGWEAVRTQGWRAPMHWVELDGAWHEFTLAGLRPLDLAAPVCHVSGYEADAFARWSKARLPTEPEWEHAAAKLPVRGRFADTGRLHPDRAPEQDTLRGDAPVQMFGDVWAWTSSDYAPYPGYAPWSGNLAEYNGKFMSNQRVLRGGSCVTPPGHVRASYRNFFPLEARWQFSGVRLARDAR